MFCIFHLFFEQKLKEAVPYVGAGFFASPASFSDIVSSIKVVHLEIGIWYVHEFVPYHIRVPHT